MLLKSFLGDLGKQYKLPTPLKRHMSGLALQGLLLRTQVGFLAKNQLPSKASDSIIIPRLSNYCKSDNFNRMLCPVRAVKIYLKRTKSLRKHRKRLFIPIRGDQD